MLKKQSGIMHDLTWDELMKRQLDMSGKRREGGGTGPSREVLLLGTPAAKSSFTSSKPLLPFLLLNLILPVNTCHSKHLELLVVQLLYTQINLREVPYMCIHNTVAPVNH